MTDKIDDLKKALKEQKEQVNLARESKDKLASLDEKLETATAAMRKAAPAAAPKTHTVVSGDTLTGIAKQYGKESWKEVYEANKL
ncbi:MAG: LysM peptidoglycan-binding domain-containing protein [Ardenticatenaceae bacterium]|nr:LysM peptidoglycan-binding domain-containing protein [Ardenticatenaceae bacterium]MCB9444482.1 LysM peptidoglycan-binding domain-containing protein [Ardenticatenaceae bacterium]